MPSKIRDSLFYLSSFRSVFSDIQSVHLWPLTEYIFSVCGKDTPHEPRRETITMGTVATVPIILIWGGGAFEREKPLWHRYRLNWPGL